MVKLSALSVIAMATCAFAQSQEPLYLDATTRTSLPPVRRASDAVQTSLFYENDSMHLKPNNATDRHYTGGGAVLLQWQSPETSDLISQLPSIDGEFAPESLGTSYGAGFIVSLQVYTPEDIAASQPIYDDRPYAGLLYGGLIVQRANRAAEIPVFEHFELDLGTIGPASRGGATQEWLHKTFVATYPQGWGYQVRDDFGGDFKYLRRWRFDLDSRGAETSLQLIPEAGVTAGTMHINASAGLTLRYGWNMPDDFGPSRVRYAGDFTRPLSHENPQRLFGGYLFLRPGGRIVAHDSTIDGSYFRDSQVELDSQPWVAEIAAGFAVQFEEHFEIAYYQTYTSPEFTHSSTWDGYATIMVSAVFAW